MSQSAYYKVPEKGRLNMAVYHTRYFGDFEADDDETVEIETTLEEDGETIEVAIVISHFEDYKGRVHEIIELLDKYYELHEAAKAYIGERYEGNEDFIDFIFKYAGQWAKRVYKRNGNKSISFDLDDLIKRLDPPSVSFQEYRSGKIAARLAYYGPDCSDFSLNIDMDKDRKIYAVQYYDGY
jgi:hypothetical protein